MQIFKHRHFNHWAKFEGITDKILKQAIIELEQGLFEANLGGGLYKKRVACKGKGKRSGYRTLIAFRRGDKAIFVYGFAKKVKDNIKLSEKEIYKKLAQYYLGITKKELTKLLTTNKLIEVL